MTDQEIQKAEGLTRREVLKKGALLGGALAWGTPVVQVIGMRPALAQTTSPDCPNLYCLKAEVSGGSLGPFGPLGGGQGKGKGNCLGTPDNCDHDVPQSILDYLNSNVSGDPETGFTVKLPPGCRLAELSGGSEDPFGGMGPAAAAKCGKKGTPGSQDPADWCFGPTIEGNELTFICDNDSAVSHIELIICCA
jgi:hypothetical protein